MPVNVDLSGLDRIAAGLSSAVDAGVEKAAEQIKDLASQLAPEETGLLKDSGDVTGDKGSKKRIVSFGNGLPDIRAVAQEYGTLFSAPQPYLTPASQHINVEIAVRDEVSKIIG